MCDARETADRPAKAARERVAAAAPEARPPEKGKARRSAPPIHDHGHVNDLRQRGALRDKVRLLHPVRPLPDER